MTDQPNPRPQPSRSGPRIMRSQTGRRLPLPLVGLVLLTVIVAVLLVLWLITALEGDSTNHLEENQPSPSASSPS